MKKYEEILVNTFISAVLLNSAANQLFPDTSDTKHLDVPAGSYEVKDGISSTLVTFLFLPDFSN